MRHEIRVTVHGPYFRAIDPKWSHVPLSGNGAAICGGRFNEPGESALYLSSDAGTAIRERQRTTTPSRDSKNALSHEPSTLPGQYVSNGLQESQGLSRSLAVMCHDRSTFDAK